MAKYVTNSQNSSKMSDAEIKNSSQLENAEDALISQVKNRFKRFWPDDVTDVAISFAKDTIDTARAALQSAQALLGNTYVYRICADEDPNQSTNKFERGFGVVAIWLMVICATMIPFFAAISIVESQKISAIADHPVLGLVMGAAPLAGILASIEWRSTLTSDHARLRFEKSLLIATMTILMLWSILMAFSAYPLEIGGQLVETSDAWGKQTMGKTGGISFETPTSLIFIVTTLLDLLAAPTLHRIALKRVSPRTIKRIEDDAERVHVRDKIIPVRKAELQDALADYELLLARRTARENALEDDITDALARLANIKSQVNAAQVRAAQAVLGDGFDDDLPF